MVRLLEEITGIRTTDGCTSSPTTPVVVVIRRCGTVSSTGTFPLGTHLQNDKGDRSAGRRPSRPDTW
nr:unnamed protein product [Callosobruchus analis]